MKGKKAVIPVGRKQSQDKHTYNDPRGAKTSLKADAHAHGQKRLLHRSLGVR